MGTGGQKVCGHAALSLYQIGRKVNGPAEKPTYEFMASRNEYRKRIKGPDGKYIAIYGKTPEELSEKVAIARREIEEEVYRRENPTVEECFDVIPKWIQTIIRCQNARKRALRV